MLKTFALSTALALSLAACASAPSAPDKAQAAANAKPPAGCVAQTGTRIPVKDGSMACAGFGNTYTRQDIDHTGQFDLSRALPMMDPAVSRTH